MTLSIRNEGLYTEGPGQYRTSEIYLTDVMAENQVGLKKGRISETDEDGSTSSSATIFEIPPVYVDFRKGVKGNYSDNFD
jgi:hypothetical protein